MSIADPDGAWRTLLQSGSPNRFYKRWQGHLYAEDGAERLAGTARRSLARGRCVTVRTDEEYVITLSFSDEYSRHDSPFSLDREAPHVRIGDVFSIHSVAANAPSLVPTTHLPEPMVALGTPILYGMVTDDFRIFDDPPVVPIGINKAYYVGNFLIGDVLWHGYLVSLYAIKRVTALFGSDQNPDCPASVRLDPDIVGDQFLVANSWYPWPFVDTYIEWVKDGKTYWTTMFFGRGPISQAHVDGKVPISFNAEGIEDVGDGSGEVIDALAYIAQHFLDHPVLRGTTSGLWGATAQFSDGVAILRTSSFATVKAEHDLRLCADSGDSTALGDELVSNGSFDTDPTGPDSWNDSDWAGGWSWDGSKAVHAPGSADAIRAIVLGLLEGMTYRVWFTQAGCTAGTLTVNLYDGSGPATVLGPDNNGLNVLDLTAGADGSGDSSLKFDASSDYDGSIDDV